jgi:hypothetical protein
MIRIDNLGLRSCVLGVVAEMSHVSEKLVGYLRESCSWRDKAEMTFSGYLTCGEAGMLPEGYLSAYAKIPP